MRGEGGGLSIPRNHLPLHVRGYQKQRTHDVSAVAEDLFLKFCCFLQVGEGGEID